jgi:hypothetical protein
MRPNGRYNRYNGETASVNCTLPISSHVWVNSIAEVVHEHSVNKTVTDMQKLEHQAKENEHGRDRTCNLLIRSQAPCHWATHPIMMMCSLVLFMFSQFSISLSDFQMPA